jgi:tRNA C32,U32 (ribose-2'-O)-methylase TrmJ
VVNIATAVRAMMNMGLRWLRLVAPPRTRIANRARSESVLERAEFFDTLEAAVRDVVTVVPTARKRT